MPSVSTTLGLIKNVGVQPALRSVTSQTGIAGPGDLFPNSQPSKVSQSLALRVLSPN